MIRLFSGWRLPADLSRQIDARLQPVRNELPRASWVSSENLHLTFGFFGDVEIAQAEDLARRLGETLSGFTSLRAAIGPSGAFDSARKVRAAWISIDGGPMLPELAAAVAADASSAGIETDQKPFRPHITLARPKERWTSEDLETFCNPLNDLLGVQTEIDHVSLIRSTLTSSGPVYTDLARIDLAPSSEEQVGS